MFMLQWYSRGKKLNIQKASVFIFIYFQEAWQHPPGDVPANCPDEHDQPGHQLHLRGGQVQPDPADQHHLHDGPGLGLPLSLRQPSHHLGHQASGGLAHIQLGLPFSHHSRQCSASGRNYHSHDQQDN